jgi:hypothetical protein
MRDARAMHGDSFRPYLRLIENTISLKFLPDEGRSGIALRRRMLLRFGECSRGHCCVVVTDVCILSKPRVSAATFSSGPYPA